MKKKANFMVFDVKELIDDLEKGVVDILFEKKDGTNRLLKATLQSSYFRKPFISAEEAQSRANLLANEGETGKVPVIHCWDVEQNEWRSFRTDHVLSLQITNG